LIHLEFGVGAGAEEDRRAGGEKKEDALHATGD
jgi:hypothetical protein